MIDWLNDNSGAVQAISVAVLAVVTAVYAIATMKIGNATTKQAEASVRMTEEMREQRLAEHMPLLLVDLLDYNTGGMKPGPERRVDDCYPASLSFRVTNVGDGPAIDVEMAVVHSQVHYWRSATKGYLLTEEPLDYDTSESIYPPSGRGLSDCLRECQVPIQADYNLGFVARYRDIHERVWLAWMSMEYDSDLGGDDNREVIWWIEHQSQHVVKLADEVRDRSWDVFFGGGSLNPTPTGATEGN